MNEGCDGRQTKLETLLFRRFPEPSREQIAAAANAVMGLEDEWEEVGTQEEFGHHVSVQCADICVLAREAGTGVEFRLLRRRSY